MSDFDIPEDTPVDKEFVKEATSNIKGLGKDIISNKMAETQLIQQSIAEGGPSSPNEAVINLMQYLNVGIRYLAGKVGVRRKMLVRMLEGHTPMPPEVMVKIHEVFKTKQPTLFDFERNKSDG